MIEYRVDDFAETCTDYGASHAVVLRDRNLTPDRRARVVLTVGETLHTTDLGRVRAAGWSSATACSGRAATSPGIGKALADKHRVTLVDMPDHGRSPWSDRFDYVAAADQVAEPAVGRRPGHTSRALHGRQDRGRGAAAQELVERLVVVDVAPYMQPHNPSTTATSPPCTRWAWDPRTALQLRRRSSRGGARITTMHSFLLQNLRHEDSGERRPLAMAAQPRTARPRPRRHHGLARDRTGHHAAVRRAGGEGRHGAAARDTCAATTSRPWTLVDAKPAGHDQGRRALGAQRRPRSSWRCCAEPRH